MDISKRAARGLVTKGMNAVKDGDFERASRQLEILNGHKAWWSARQLGAYIKRQVANDEAFLAAHGGLAC